jgi:hypothetical protein
MYSKPSARLAVYGKGDFGKKAESRQYEPATPDHQISDRAGQIKAYTVLTADTDGSGKMTNFNLAPEEKSK